MAVPALLERQFDKEQEGEEDVFEDLHGEALIPAHGVGPHAAREVVHEGHGGRAVPGQVRERERRHVDQVAAPRGDADAAAREVEGVDAAFFGGGEGGDDAAEAGGVLRQGEQVDEEADPAVVGYGHGVGEAFGCVWWEESRSAVFSGRSGRPKFRHTSIHLQRALALEEHVDGGLPLLDVAADVVDVGEQAGVGGDKCVLAAGVQGGELGQEPVAGMPGAADELDTGPEGAPGEVLQGRLADAGGGADEDGHQARGQGRGDAGVGGLDLGVGRHGGRWGCGSACGV